MRKNKKQQEKKWKNTLLASMQIMCIDQYQNYLKKCHHHLKNRVYKKGGFIKPPFLFLNSLVNYSTISKVIW